MKTNEAILKKAIKAFENIDRMGASMIMYSESNCTVIRNFVFIRNSRLLAVYDSERKKIIDTTNLCETKKSFLNQIEVYVNQRLKCGNKKKQDSEKHVEAAKALSELYEYVETMPEEDYLFEFLSLNLPDRDNIKVAKDELEMCGFQSKWKGPEHFIGYLIGVLTYVILRN